MLEGDRERRLGWNDPDRREQCSDTEDVEKNEKYDGKREPLSATPGRIVEDLSISHDFALIRYRRPCQ
jgi:hypothetical protein